jgi:hypothetical protein
MASTTRLFYGDLDITSAPPSERRILLESTEKTAYFSFGTTSPEDWKEVQMKKRTAVHETTSRTLTADDEAKVLVFNGDNIGITLPNSSTIAPGWRVTIVNENMYVSQADSAIVHSLSPANKEIGKRNLVVSRVSSDTLNGIGTNLRGFCLIIPPKEVIDIWLTSSGEFAAAQSSTVGWRDLPSAPIGSVFGGREPAFSQIGSSFLYALRFTDAGSGAEKTVFYSSHINHDYVMGSRVYPHVHWNPGDTVATTVVGWAWEYAIVKGHGQQAIPLTGTICTASTTLSGTPYVDYISEVSDANSLPATNLEPDACIHFRLIRDSANTYGSGDTTTTSAYLQFVDLHYLSTLGGTPLKVPPFYL